MFRRVICRALPTIHGLRFLTVNTETRETLTKPLSSLKEECKGQNLDLADMAEAMKAVTQRLQDASKKADVEDKQFKGKLATLSASVKAYNTRLSNLKNETRSIQTEVDALMKLLWGSEKPEGASFSMPPPPSAATASAPAEDFSVEPPHVSQALHGSTTSPKVERVEGERVRDGAAKASSNDGGESVTEIDVETIEVETEPAAAEEDSVDTMKVTDITKELYERGVNFSDCMDARSLRQRYRDVLSGKIPSGVTGGAASPNGKGTAEPLSANSNQPRMPSHNPSAQQQTYRSSPPPPNTSESGIATDPYPNASRKMVDPMKYIYQIKHEIAVEKGVDPNSVDLWSGKVKLEDNKRLYDYPSIQSYPIEVRQKGDIPM